MNDIGFVRYSKNKRQGIDASWHYWKDGKIKSGTGIVKGQSGETFAGDYQVTYYDQNSIETTSFQLRIRQIENYYMIEWLTDGKVEYVGTGVEVDASLVAGWRKVSE